MQSGTAPVISICINICHYYFNDITGIISNLVMPVYFTLKHSGFGVTMKRIHIFSNTLIGNKGTFGSNRQFLIRKEVIKLFSRSFGRISHQVINKLKVMGKISTTGLPKRNKLFLKTFGKNLSLIRSNSSNYTIFISFNKLEIIVIFNCFRNGINDIRSGIFLKKPEKSFFIIGHYRIDNISIANIIGSNLNCSTINKEGPA